MYSDLLYQIALSMTPRIGAVQAKILAGQFGSAEAVFNAKTRLLTHIEGIGEMRAASIRSFSSFDAAEKEIRFIEKSGITPLYITHPNYPRRLLNCYDSPPLLYYKGDADLNASRILAIVGTRHHTSYGKMLVEKFVTALAPHQVLIISGLAWGIDALAHRASLKNGLQTVGVLAHGLDQVYPPQHIPLAKEMLRQGGLLTEYRSGTNPDKHNFPNRNRIVAGMSDATVVIESGIRGGSLITAELANGYNRDVFAFPGKTSDPKSAGCNQLIRTNKAILLTEADELLDLMGWSEQKKPAPSAQRQLFIELSASEKLILDLLNEKEATHIDELSYRCGISASALAGHLLNLELQHIIESLPGKMYRLI